MASPSPERPNRPPPNPRPPRHNTTPSFIPYKENRPEFSVRESPGSHRKASVPVPRIEKRRSCQSPHAPPIPHRKTEKNVPPRPAVSGLPPMPPQPAVRGTPPRPNSTNFSRSPRGRGISVRARGRGNRGRGSPAPVSKDTVIFHMMEPPPIEVSPWYPLVDLFTRNNQIVSRATIQATGTNSLDQFAPGLVNLYAANKDLFTLLLPVIKKEVSSTETAGTLFRGNCLASKLLSAFCYQVSSQFLKNILLAPITYIADSPDNYEVNPVKMPKGENLEKNIENLCEAVKFFLNSIILGLPHCPLIIRRICYELRLAVSDKFPNSSYSVIGGFFFLRFICPAIISPEGFDVVDWKIPEKARRPLVLISKVIQNLGNGVEFGSKENFMLPLNPFIQEYLPRIESFFDTLAFPDNVQFIVPPRTELQDSLMEKLHSHIYLIQNKVCKILNEYEEETVCLRPGMEVKEFHATIDYLGVPKLLQGKDIKQVKKQLKKEQKQMGKKQMY